MRALRQAESRRIIEALTKTQKHAASAPHSLSLCISMQCGPVRKLAHSSKEMEREFGADADEAAADDGRGSCFFCCPIYLRLLFLLVRRMTLGDAQSIQSSAEPSRL